MSEFELNLIRQRSREAIQQKAGGLSCNFVCALACVGAPSSSQTNMSNRHFALDGNTVGRVLLAMWPDWANPTSGEYRGRVAYEYFLRHNRVSQPHRSRVAESRVAVALSARWLADTDTESVIPGDDMSSRLNDASKRADIIAYLKQLSGKRVA